MNRFVAIDIGNSTISGAVVESARELRLDETPFEVDLTNSAPSFLQRLDDEPVLWWAVSVNRSRTEALRDWLSRHRPSDELRLLDHDMVDLPLRVDFPERVGMDRVAAAVAANRRRGAENAAIIVDSGTAITVDAVDQGGRFVGGAILPGVGMSAAALDRGTDALPRIIPLETPPDSIGTNTEAAIRSGLFWGSFGGVKELIARHRTALAVDCSLYLTGGAAVWDTLLPEAQLAPNLTLHGVAIIAVAQERTA